MKYLVKFAFLLLLIALIIGCTAEKKETLPQYEGWGTYTYRHFIYHFPENSYWARNMDKFSAGYEKYLAEDCEFLAIDMPTDTIHFYIHNNPEDGKKLTGRDLPFHTDNQIHWERQSPFGLELAKFLIDKMDIRKTDYQVLYDGLATLRDYSGRDFHHNTAAYLEIGRFIPLDTLIDNNAYARANKNQREGEAASLVAFITYNWGINRFKMLWQSTNTFEQSTRELFEYDLKTFEDKWLEFAMARFQGITKDTVYQDSSRMK
ncbi:MAG: hypothetical protein ABIJ45_00265 [Candidatus Zixiibacteriota bacterium]